MADPTPTTEPHPVAPVPRLLLNAEHAAEALDIKPRKLWELTKLGESGDPGGIPCVRIGRAVRYDPADLRAWVLRKKGGDG